ncbi:hypothetical protein CC86DRAFT_15571 [Ophiobolus disseminans]|uniref:Uncharacterized protein n=1 Tax=Ophiobolus disseminans TaxID=1469910 RepID=A0A6A7AKZ4_9PLEO|nr:hypothetical protein CC86DRAFT_15571 [Ophiobolus disseminans]
MGRLVPLVVFCARTSVGHLTCVALFSLHWEYARSLFSFGFTVGGASYSGSSRKALAYLLARSEWLFSQFLFNLSVSIFKSVGMQLLFRRLYLPCAPSSGVPRGQAQSWVRLWDPLLGMVEAGSRKAVQYR